MGAKDGSCEQDVGTMQGDAYLTVPHALPDQYHRVAGSDSPVETTTLELSAPVPVTFSLSLPLPPSLHTCARVV